MTGHQHDKQSRGAHPLRTAHPDLDQHAAALAHARTTGDPLINDLAKVEPAFIAELLRRLDDTDPTTIGAVLLIAGNLASQVLDHLDETHQPQGGPILANLLQLAGQQLYTAKVPSRTGCTGVWPSGKPCKSTFEAADDEQLAAVVRGHMALHHPDQTWPPPGIAAQEAALRDTLAPLRAIVDRSDELPEPPPEPCDTHGWPDCKVCADRQRNGQHPDGYRDHLPDGGN